MTELTLDFQNGAGYFSTKPTKVELIPVNSYKIHYEIHGNGPKKILFITGLMASMAGWEPIVHHFADLRGDEYSCLLIENRGFGFSTGNFGRFTTQGMAEDAAAVLEHAGWNQPRSVHLAGISMGGMISQELALLLPDRFKSLSLLATCAKHVSPKNESPAALRTIRSMFLNEHERLDNLFYTLFSDEEWMKSKPERFDYESNYDKFMKTIPAQMKKRPAVGLTTFIGQGTGVLTHHVKEDRLAKLGEHIPNVVAMTGTADRLIDPSCTEHLAKHIGAKAAYFEGKGHGLPSESFTETLQEMLEVIHAGETRWAT
ncbi:Alpha/Beta hydrolase protein [Globomyces pollinis-pini]|nr:Alpha/Beta hydrolase protein [Globomyces pollinis-pini]